MARASIPAAEVRTRLLRDCLEFVQTAQQVPGVVRIALVGSITSVKQAPKDVDVLVTVSDHSDLTPLALAGRRLKGRTQSYNLGADVFLANEVPRYIGRICHWKDCRPGVRASCDAQHCGQRPFLHDDLASVSLSDKVISEPPVELWPRLHCRVVVPVDVEHLLLSQLEPGRHYDHDDAA